jgi:hypothetical protein
MAFDPTKPANGSPQSAAEMRMQFTALKALIDALTALVTTLQQQVTAQAQAIAALQSAGFITQAQLDAAIATCAKNVNQIEPSGVGASDPPQQSEVQDLMNKVAELIVALHR